MGKPGRTLGNGVGLDYRALFDAVPGLYLILDRALTIVAANDAYCRGTMTERDRIVGRPLFEVFPDNPDDPKADGTRNLHASLARVIELKRSDAMATQKYDIPRPQGGFEERHWNPINVPVLGQDGEVRWIVHRVEDVTELVKLKTESAARDRLFRDQQRVIEELRAANLELARALDENARLEADARYLASIVESSTDAIYTKDLNGTVTSWNKAAEKLVGYTADEVVGKRHPEFLAPEILEEERGMIERMRRGEMVAQVETRRPRKDGTLVYIFLTASPIRDRAGEIVGISKIARDITDLKEAEEKMQNLQAELVHLARWNTMGMMASTIAHELNQPLTAVVNYVRAARRTLTGSEDPKAGRAGEYLDKAVDETKLAAGIIRSLREFIDKRETTRAPENINQVVEEAMTLSLAGGPDAKARTRVTLDPVLPPVFVDRIQIQQVLLNLVRNAAEAMAGGPGELAIRTEPEEPGFIAVSVSDNGPGIAPEIAAQLFQPFTTTKEKGMGIGLTICRSIIEAHGGRIWVEPNKLGGTVFRFRLPVAAEADHGA